MPSTPSGRRWMPRCWRAFSSRRAAARTSRRVTSRRALSFNCAGGDDPPGGPPQQLGLDLRSDGRVLDRGDLVQHRPEVPRVKGAGLERGQRPGQPVHQVERLGQQRVGGRRAARQRDHELACGPLADRPQDLGAGGPALGAHRARLALGPVGGGRPVGGELGHRAGPHRGLPTDLAVRCLDLAQGPVGQRDGRSELRPLGGCRARLAPSAGCHGPTARLDVPVAGRRRRHVFDHTFERAGRQAVRGPARVRC